MPWASFKEMRNEARQEARQDPKWAIEGDVVIAAVGLVIALIGGSVTAAGFVWVGGLSAPAPVLGTIIFIVGVLVVLLGLGLAALNIARYVSRKRSIK